MVLASRLGREERPHSPGNPFGRVIDLSKKCSSDGEGTRPIEERRRCVSSACINRLANAGIADAALALAATYDPRYLAQHNPIGVVGDETKARDWYQRASELGSAEAGRILAQTNDD